MQSPLSYLEMGSKDARYTGTKSCEQAVLFGFRESDIGEEVPVDAGFQDTFLSRSLYKASIKQWVRFLMLPPLQVTLTYFAMRTLLRLF